ncbi:hypothetical protein RvY_06894, partial [Ramazzottius varieornatus]
LKLKLMSKLKRTNKKFCPYPVDRNHQFAARAPLFKMHSLQRSTIDPTSLLQ